MKSTWLTNNYNTHIPISHTQSKSSQAMKFGQAIEYNKTIFFFKKHAENEAERLVPDLPLFFRKALYEVEASVLQLSFNIL